MTQLDLSSLVNQMKCAKGGGGDQCLLGMQGLRTKEPQAQADSGWGPARVHCPEPWWAPTFRPFSLLGR
jgi:hypothetical protein